VKAGVANVTLAFFVFTTGAKSASKLLARAE
jgi:hypothetical protein